MGRIAQKIRRELERVLRQKVASFEAFRRGKQRAESIKSMDQLLREGRDPLHALYANTTNLAGLFMEDLFGLPFLDRAAAFIEEVQDDYQASYPPMSPITVSFYMHWLLYDVRFGADQETIGELLLAVSDLLKLDSAQLEALRNLCGSRVGIFEARAVGEGRYRLRELVTSREVEAVIPSGYNNSHTALMLVRLAPPLYGLDGHHVSLTTPYMLLGTTEQDWMDYFHRQQVAPRTEGGEERLHRHLKYGPDKRYWPEYVLKGYVNFLSDRIFLTGFPDRPETLPHDDSFDPSTFPDHISVRINSLRCGAEKEASFSKSPSFPTSSDFP